MKNTVDFALLSTGFRKLFLWFGMKFTQELLSHLTVAFFPRTSSITIMFWSRFSWEYITCIWAYQPNHIWYRYCVRMSFTYLSIRQATNFPFSFCFKNKLLVILMPWSVQWQNKYLRFGYFIFYWFSYFEKYIISKRLELGGTTDDDGLDSLRSDALYMPVILSCNVFAVNAGLTHKSLHDIWLPT